MPRQRARDHRCLASHTFGIKAGAGATQLLRRQRQQATGQRAGGGGVGDAHFSPDKQLRSAPTTAAFTLSAPAASANVICAGVIAGRSQKLAVHGAMIARRTPAISPGSLTVPRFTTSSVAPSVLARTLIAAPPRGEVAHHLAGHRLRERRIRPRRPRHDRPQIRYPHLVHCGRFAPLHGRELDRRLLQRAERTLRLGQLLLPLPGTLCHGSIGWGARFDQPVMAHGKSPFRASGRPAATKITRSTARGEALVQATCLVDEPSAELTDRHDAETDLVADQQEFSRKHRQNVEQGFALALQTGFVPDIQQIAQPKRQAVDQHRQRSSRAYRRNASASASGSSTHIQCAGRRAR